MPGAPPTPGGGPKEVDQSDEHGDASCFTYPSQVDHPCPEVLADQGSLRSWVVVHTGSDSCTS